MEVYMKRKVIQLERSTCGGHRVVVVTEHQNGLARRGMVTKNGALWLGRTIASMVMRAANLLFRLDK